MAYKSPMRRTYTFSLPGQASGTVGQLSKANSSTGNPGGLISTTSSGNPGINNGGCDPYVVGGNCTVVRATLTVAHAAVSQGTTGSAMVARFDLYSVGYSARTLLQTFHMPITSAGVFTNLGGDNFQTSSVDLSISVPEGTLIGCEFVNESTTNNNIVALGGVFLELTADEN